MRVPISPADIDKLTMQVEYLTDRAAIEDVLKRYSRALDWLDRDLLESVFSDDAEIDYGFFRGRGTEFKPYLLRISAESRRRWHFTSQVSIRIDGSTADVESYNFAVALDGDKPHAGELVAHFYGFYLDRMEKRRQGWTIIARKHVLVSSAFLNEAMMKGEYAALNQIGPTKEVHPDFRVL